MQDIKKTQTRKARETHQYTDEDLKNYNVSGKVLGKAIKLCKF